MARSNLHELATRFLQSLHERSADGQFQGKLTEVAAAAGLNSVRSSEAIRLLEEIGRVDVVQRGRRGRDTVISLLSDAPVTPSDAADHAGSRAVKKTRVTYDDIGKAAVDRLLALGREDGLRAAQVEAFAGENGALKLRIQELESEVAGAERRENSLRIQLRSAQEALERSEENLKRMFAGGDRSPSAQEPVADDDARAVLDILRSGGGG